jgi:DNA-binding XRE family transcriptional regulator
MKTKTQVQADFNLEILPTDVLMDVLAELEALGVTEGPVQGGPNSKVLARSSLSPDQIGEAVLFGSLENMLTEARNASGLSVAELGHKLGVNRARANQILKAPNMQLDTLLRLAHALGYRLSIELEPIEPLQIEARKPLKIAL